jgi:hypothetical protein
VDFLDARTEIGQYRERRLDGALHGRMQGHRRRRRAARRCACAAELGQGRSFKGRRSLETSYRS